MVQNLCVLYKEKRNVSIYNSSLRIIYEKKIHIGFNGDGKNTDQD